MTINGNMWHLPDVVVEGLTNHHFDEIENERQDIDPDSSLVRLLKGLYDCQDNEVEVKVLAINNFFNEYGEAINPSYKAIFHYHGRQSRLENFFSMVADLDNVADEIKTEWLTQLANFLLAYLNLIQDLSNVDNVWCIKTLLTNLEPSPELDVVICRLTDNSFNLSELEDVYECYPKFFDVMLSEEVLQAKKLLGLATSDLIALRGKYKEEVDVEQNDENFCQILSLENIARVKKERTEGHFCSIIHSLWPEDESLHIKMLDQKFVQLLTHSQVKLYIESGYADLEFFMNCSTDELERLVYIETLSQVQNAIESTRASRTYVYAASTQQSANNASNSMDEDRYIVAESLVDLGAILATAQQSSGAGKRKR